MKRQQELHEDSAVPHRGYPYRRYSAGKQGVGDSMRRQGDWAKQVCAEQGWFYDDTYALDDKGRSGFHQKNLAGTAGLARFLDLIKTGRIARGSVLIVENIDRLSRADVDTAHDLFRSIIRAGIWICTKTPFRVYKGDKEASFMDLLEPIWIMYCAYMESLKKSDRVASAWEANRNEARAQRLPHQARPPWWLERMATGYRIRTEQGQVMREIVREASQGAGIGTLCRTLTERGIPAPGYSGRWTDNGLRCVLRGRQLVGEYQPHQLIEGKRVPCGEPIRGFYPALLSEDEWLLLQAAIDNRRDRSGRPAGEGRINLFTGLIRDAVTRRPLALKTHGKKVRRQRYQFLKVTGALGGKARMVYQDAEEAVLGTVAQLRTQDVLIPSKQSRAREERIGTLTRRMMALEQRAREIKKAIEDPDNVAAVGALAKSLTAVEAERLDVTKERDSLKLECLSGPVEALEETQSLLGYRATVTGKERLELDRQIKLLLPTVVEEVWIQCQRISPKKQIIHFQIYLRGGKMRYMWQASGKLPHVEPWYLQNWDLRKGPYEPGGEMAHTAT